MDNIEVVSKKEKMLESSGVTRKVVYDRLREGLNATKKVLVIDENGRQVEVEEADHGVRHKFIDTAVRVYGDIKADAVVDNRKVSINMVGVNKEVVDGIWVMVKDVRGQLEGLKGSGHQTGEIIDVN